MMLEKTVLVYAAERPSSTIAIFVQVEPRDYLPMKARTATEFVLRTAISTNAVFASKERPT
jgi:hypothetical protein